MKNPAFILSCALLSALALSSCASVADTQKVQMTLRTPGTDNAKCYIENKDHKYVAYTDQTIEVMKTPYDYAVRCLAPGNREKTVIAKREINQWVFANVANGFVPGAAYDVLSHGAFDYPNEVSVSFEGVAKQCDAMAPYEKGDHCQPTTTAQVENFTLQKKEHLFAQPVYEEQGGYEAPQLGFIDEKSNPPILEKRRKAYDLPAVSYDPTEEDK